MKKTTIIALTIIILLWTSNSIIAQTQNTTKDVSVTILLNEYYNETKNHLPKNLPEKNLRKTPGETPNTCLTNHQTNQLTKLKYNS